MYCIIVTVEKKKLKSVDIILRWSQFKCWAKYYDSNDK